MTTHPRSLRTLLAILTVLFAAQTFAAEPAAKPATRAADPNKPNPMKDVADVAALPRVLLIGDSISIGYTLPVRDRLKAVANVHRPPTNCNATIHGLASLDKWLGDPNTPQGRWDVIHFNWGLHDLKHHDGKGNIVDVDKGPQQVPVDEYEKNLHTLVKRLKATGATLIFATTTPVPEGAKGRVPADVAKYNDAALRVMKEEGVAVDDLNSFITPKLAELQNKKDVHYTPAGYNALADQVAESIRKALAERKK
jgi:lysophospholipase L1-like esterase